MKQRQWDFIDKTAWPQGVWQDEPDKVQWQDKETGLPCLAVRHPSLGHWCGYVGVTEGHPFFGVPYSACPQNCGSEWCDHRPDSALNVHGGLTFADHCTGDPETHSICHVAEEGEDDVFWFGFDCTHSGDLSPNMMQFVSDRGDEYRTLGYVRKECRELAKQLKAIT